MEYRLLGRSGLKVSALSFGTATFAGKGDFFAKWGSTDVSEAQRLFDICVEAGINLFDTADAYSGGASEEILGKVIAAKRNAILISTKASIPMGDGPNQRGASRHHLVHACEQSLRRLGASHIDIWYMHTPDLLTPVEETLRALDDLIAAGKVRYIGISNWSGWHVMKALAAADRHGWSRFVTYQGYYSLLGREFEWELMPLAQDQGLGTVVWSPLGWGRLTGKLRRGVKASSGRIQQGGEAGGPVVADEHLYKIVDALDNLATQTGKSVPQIALNWLLQRPTVSSVVIGARNEEQLRQNLGAEGWSLDADQIAQLDAVSHVRPIYPYWHQLGCKDRNPTPTDW